MPPGVAVAFGPPGFGVRPGVPWSGVAAGCPGFGDPSGLPGAGVIASILACVRSTASRIAAAAGVGT